MIRRRSSRNEEKEKAEARGFDAFELRLGDTMRGERATMGKSLLDVERELRIKANYISAIENSDPDAFDTPGFIPGYVRSYARYLNMDPDEAFKVLLRGKWLLDRARHVRRGVLDPQDERTHTPERRQGRSADVTQHTVRACVRGYVFKHRGPGRSVRPWCCWR